MTYTINYHGLDITEEIVTSDLVGAKNYCEFNAEFITEDIDIIQDGLIVTTLKWYNTEPCGDDIVAAEGFIGFYSWLDM